MPKQLQFPDPSEVSDGNPCVLRGNEIMVAIYNQEHNANAKNLSARIHEWVAAEATKKGWKRVTFPLSYPSKTLIAGCVFEKK
jgi:hypothetical protein